MPPFSTVDELFTMLAAGAQHDDDEDVDVLAHSLQCAAILAAQAPTDRELQVAGLVHDVGWMIEPHAPAAHAPVGGALVGSLLGERVAHLVARHADAKRYLITTDPSYRTQLSDRSAVTLEHQGGVLDHDELLAMRADPELRSVLALRRADDRAKVPDLDVPDLEHWRDDVDALARTVSGTPTR